MEAHLSEENTTGSVGKVDLGGIIRKRLERLAVDLPAVSGFNDAYEVLKSEAKAIEQLVNDATPSGGGEKRPWTEGKLYKWSEICGHFEEVQPSDYGEDTAILNWVLSNGGWMDWDKNWSRESCLSAMKSQT